MKSITSAFTEAQKRRDTYPVRHVYYKRRYWDTGTNSYIYEGSWTQLADAEVVAVQQINHQLDPDTLNEFKVSNAVIVLKNTSNEWKDTNSSGKFGSDLVSSFGYEPYLMKFQVKAGLAGIGNTDIRSGALTYEGTTEETVILFTGVATDYQYDSESGTVRITVEGMEKLLQSGDAERVSTTVSLETIGTGDGTTTQFNTANYRVGKITAVTVNGVAKTIGIDYTVSNLNSLTDAATITFADAPVSGRTIRASYVYWKGDQLIEDLIEDLVVEAGISPYSISPAAFSSISGRWLQTTQAHWQAGTNTTTDLTSSPGNIKVDFLAAANTATIGTFDSGTPASNGWTVITNDWTVTGGKLRGWYSPAPPPYIYTDALIRKSHDAANHGKWEFKMRCGDVGVHIDVHFMAQRDDNFNVNGYTIQWNQTGDFTFLKSNTTVSTSLGTTVISKDTTEHTVKVIRTVSGVFTVYFDGVLKFTVTDTTYTVSDRFLIHVALDDAPSLTDGAYFDDIITPVLTFTATFQSQTKDTAGGLTAWGDLIFDQTSSGGTISYQTRVSDDGISWDSWVSTGGGDAIQSALKRYFQFKISISVTNALTYDPTIHEIAAEWTSSTVLIRSADFTGKTCYQAIKELASFCNFEYGVDTDGSFFFRSKDVSATIDETFTQSQNLSEVMYLRNGYDKVYGVVRATFGTFTVDKVDADNVRTSALERFGRKIYTVPGSSMLIDDDIDIATGIAETYSERLFTQRKKLKIKTKFYPQIELADTVSITFQHDPFSSVEQFVESLSCKVIGARHDLDNWYSEFDLEEII